jgi:anaerobic selenocysteine-containing dehydrogenase
MSLDLVTRHRLYREEGFATPTRRLEVYSEKMLDAGLSPVPECAPGPLPLSKDYPLRLTSAKSPHFCHSQHHALPSLRRRMPEPLVELHPDLARQNGIQESDWVTIQSLIGVMRARALITESIAVDVVCAQYGWWEDSPDLGLSGYGIAEANYNKLIDDESFDPASGSNSLNGYPCSIKPEKNVRSGGQS